MIIIVIGVAGSGKTTIGSRLAGELGWPFYDADGFHSQTNVEKMRAGNPLTDEDRQQWLTTLGALVAELSAAGRSGVLACSALKAAYRNRLCAAAGAEPHSVRFVYLRIPPAIAEERMNQREGHFMPAGLVQSQFEVLEEPSSAIEIDATLLPGEVLARIRAALEA